MNAKKFREYILRHRERFPNETMICITMLDSYLEDKED